MMVSRCDHFFLTPRRSLWLLALSMTMTWYFSASERVAALQLRGELGGKVTFHCPVAKQRKITFLYFQRGQIFVNGYHASNNVSQLAWKNTRVDDKTTMHMYDLNITHNGDYQCHILYSDGNMQNVDLHLRVTANFSTPAHTALCREDNSHFSCQVTCASHGGYPGAQVIWNVMGSQTWRVVNSSEIRDPHTMTVNSSSTAHINCSDGEPTTLSCFVGDATSDLFSVCNRAPPEGPNETHVIIAICVMIPALFATVVVLLCYKCKKGRRVSAGTTAVPEAAEWRGNECEEELTALNENKEGKEAP